MSILRRVVHAIGGRECRCRSDATSRSSRTTLAWRLRMDVLPDGTERLPTFRYHPDPTATDVFDQQDATCPCCLRSRGWVYIGPFYSREDPESICPWCIANGAAAEKFDAEFVDPHAVEPGASEAALDELLHRTPCHFTAHSEAWPVHCGDFCAVLRPLQLEDLDNLREEIASELSALREYVAVTETDFAFDLRREHSPLMVYLFRCLTCGKYRVNGDYE